ncbi:MAG: ATP-binding cassette domain-containing protein, partial [Kiritimatiellae bacterium]|nr:ATP-binding cassette domain-containing protein [Kiritimatiellia bacterium]
VLGGNGAGKSTMLSAAAGLIRPYDGEVRIFGTAAISSAP